MHDDNPQYVLLSIISSSFFNTSCPLQKKFTTHHRHDFFTLALSGAISKGSSWDCERLLRVLRWRPSRLGNLECSKWQKSQEAPFKHSWQWPSATLESKLRMLFLCVYIYAYMHCIYILSIYLFICLCMYLISYHFLSV